MNDKDFSDMFLKLCVLYQTPNLDNLIKNTLPEYYKNSDGSLTWLGSLPKDDFGAILDELKGDKITPPYGCTIPQLYQLLDSYREKVVPYKRNTSERKHKPMCKMCDNTGFVFIYHKATNVESVVSCICERGESIKRNMANPKQKHPFYILSYRNINWDTHSLAPTEYPQQSTSFDPKLKQILDAFLEKVGPKKEVNND